MDLNKLESFRAIARLGSLGKAAVERGLTVPALSIQLKKLEAELGTKLFLHRPKKLVLTENGHVFLEGVNRVFAELALAKASLIDPTTGYVGSMSIAISTDVARFFASGIATFIRRHPRLKVAILTRSSRDVIPMVLSGECDIGIGFYRRVPRGIAKKKFFETDISLIVPHDHPLTRTRRPSLKEIAANRVVTLRRTSGTRQMIDAAFKKSSVVIPDVLEVGRCQSVMDLVEEGLGVGLVHSICACGEPHDRLVRISMTRYFDKTDVAIITRSNAMLGSAPQALVQMLIDSPMAARLLLK
jgi:DNA-binding transcriptional LysR family regulator